MALRAEDVYERYVKMLTKDEQQRLCELLNTQLASSIENPAKFWRDFAGIAPYPLAGEDAQAWLSRSRREDDEHRMLNVEE